MQEALVGKINKKKAGLTLTKKVKVKAFKEWSRDYIRDNDEDMMNVLTE